MERIFDKLCEGNRRETIRENGSVRRCGSAWETEEVGWR